MINYYLSKTSRKRDEKHPIHRESCKYLPSLNDRIYLGNYTDCHHALNKAEKYYPKQVTGCPECSLQCYEN